MIRQAMSDVAEITKGLTEADCRLTDWQAGLMQGFWQAHDDGLISPPYFVPFGTSRLSLGGSGPALTGLLKRGLVEERNNLFYITPLGLAVRAHLQSDAPQAEGTPMERGV